MSNEFVLSISNEIEGNVKALIPTGKRESWREITFAARFRPLPTTKIKGLSLGEAMEQALIDVDFGNLPVSATDEAGEKLAPRDLALGNAYTYNAMLAFYRDEIMAKNLEAKNSKTSSGR